MRVTATQRGFYLKLRDPGDVFDIPDAGYSKKWMERVEDHPEPVETPSPVVEPGALSATGAGHDPYEGSFQAEMPEPVVKKRRGRKPKDVSE